MWIIIWIVAFRRVSWLNVGRFVCHRSVDAPNETRRRLYFSFSAKDECYRSQHRTDQIAELAPEDGLWMAGEHQYDSHLHGGSLFTSSRKICFDRCELLIRHVDRQLASSFINKHRLNIYVFHVWTQLYRSQWTMKLPADGMRSRCDRTGLLFQGASMNRCVSICPKSVYKRTFFQVKNLPLTLHWILISRIFKEPRIPLFRLLHVTEIPLRTMIARLVDSCNWIQPYVDNFYCAVRFFFRFCLFRLWKRSRLFTQSSSTKTRQFVYFRRICAQGSLEGHPPGLHKCTSDTAYRRTLGREKQMMLLENKLWRGYLMRKCGKLTVKKDVVNDDYQTHICCSWIFRRRQTSAPQQNFPHYTWYLMWYLFISQRRLLLVDERHVTLGVIIVTKDLPRSEICPLIGLMGVLCPFVGICFHDVFGTLS